MRSATSVLIGPADKIELGDGWGGAPDCVQIVSDGEIAAALSLRFLDDDSLDNLISALSQLSLDRRMRACERELAESTVQQWSEFGGDE